MVPMEELTLTYQSRYDNDAPLSEAGDLTDKYSSSHFKIFFNYICSHTNGYQQDSIW